MSAPVLRGIPYLLKKKSLAHALDLSRIMGSATTGDFFVACLLKWSLEMFGRCRTSQPPRGRYYDVDNHFIPSIPTPSGVNP